MGAIATFNYAAWIATFPEFTAIPEPTALGYFEQATGFHVNDGTGPVKTEALQLQLLNLMTAHIAALFSKIGATGAAENAAASINSLVGRISSASEGSVSVSAEYGAGATSAIKAWLDQTKYGAMYWALTLPYRMFRYRPGPQRGPWPYPWARGFMLGPWG